MTKHFPIPCFYNNSVHTINQNVGERRTRCKTQTETCNKTTQERTDDTKINPINKMTDFYNETYLDTLYVT